MKKKNVGRLVVIAGAAVALVASLINDKKEKEDKGQK